MSHRHTSLEEKMYIQDDDNNDDDKMEEEEGIIVIQWAICLVCD